MPRKSTVPPPRSALSTKTTTAKLRRKSFPVRSSVTKTVVDREDRMRAAKVVVETSKTVDRDAPDRVKMPIAVTTVVPDRRTAMIAVQKIVAVDRNPSAATTTAGTTAVIGAAARGSSVVMETVHMMAVPNRGVTTSAVMTAASRVPIAMSVVLTTAAQRDADALKVIRNTAAIGVEAKISAATTAAPKATAPMPGRVRSSAIAMEIADLATTMAPNLAAMSAIPMESGIARGTNVDRIATMIVIVAQIVDSSVTTTADLELARIK